MMNQICKKIRVIGRVQGVFYRAFAQRQAQDLQLTGWAQNEEDGSVLVIACGDEDRVEKLIQLLHQGPVAAKVTDVQVEAMDAQVLTDFVIKR
jgi:acylphosphatase